MPLIESSGSLSQKRHCLFFELPDNLHDSKRHADEKKFSMKRITASYVFFIAASLSLLGTALLDAPQDPLDHSIAAHHQSDLGKLHKKEQ